MGERESERVRERKRAHLNVHGFECMEESQIIINYLFITVIKITNKWFVLFGSAY